MRLSPRNNRLFFITVVMLVGVAATAWAWHGQNRAGDQTGGHGFGPGGGLGCLNAIFAGQELSDAQIEQIKALRSQFITATQDLQTQIRQKRLALAAELAKEQPDRETALAIFQELAALRTDLGARRIAHLLDLKEVAPNLNLLGRLARGRHHHDMPPPWAD